MTKGKSVHYSLLCVSFSFIITNPDTHMTHGHAEKSHTSTKLSRVGICDAFIINTTKGIAIIYFH